MDASILLVGGDDLLPTLLERIRDAVTCTLEVVPSPSEAVPLIQAQQPDLIILQSNQQESLALCRQVKEQTKLAWIYCIVLETSLSGLSDDRRQYLLQIEARAAALENGADAYLWLPQTTATGEPLEREMLVQQDRLLKSQILSGLRMVQTHRELIRTNDILSAIALSDPLTELNNRRALDWELPRQVQNSRMRLEPLSLLILDIDFFKTINDTHGHAVGDRVLQLISSRLRHNLRFRDTLFRYGGEEFVIILSSTDETEALLVGRRLCRLVSDQPFSVDDTMSLPVTISAGVAALRADDDPKGSSLLRRADQYLLRAKAEGRNRVIGYLDDCEEELGMWG